MMRIYQIILVCITLAASPVQGQEAAVFAPLRLADFGQRDLLAERRALLGQLTLLPPDATTADAQVARAQVVLDLAELHLAQMMRSEAAGYLAAIDPAELAPDMQGRHRTLVLALDLLSEDADPGQAVSRSVGWTEGQALRAAAFARMGATEEATRLLPQAMVALPQLSSAMTAAILPSLLETALDVENWEVAQALAGRFPDHAELREKPAYHFLLAHASEIAGDLTMAFDGYAKAAQGRDSYAHRARLAIVRLGRRTDTLSLAEALTLLESARWAWSGDAAATDGFGLLADYALEAGDTQTALWAFGKLLADSAAPEEADAIRNRARAVIGEFYAAGAAGDIELSALIEGHGKILDSWRFDPGFVALAEPLPHKLLSAGMTALAAREFRNLRFTAETAGKRNGGGADPALMDRLRLGEARALLAGGQVDAVVDLLSGLPEVADGDTETQRLLIQALSQAGRADELTLLKVRAKDIDLRRSRAVALYETGSWPAAHEALLDLWETYPKQFDFSDATRLALAAYEVGDSMTVARTVRIFPSLTDLPGWAEIAARLENQAPGEEVLGSETMISSMESAKRVLDAVTKATETR